MMFALGAILLLSPLAPLSSALSATVLPKSLLKTGGDEAAYIHSFCNAEECKPTLLSDLKIPSDFPVGTYFRNGAGRFVAQDGTKVLHMFDGDGLVSALTFNPDESVVFRSKFVQTQGYQADMEMGGMSQRGVFGTPKSGGILNNAFDMKSKNVANTNCILCGDMLLALWEGGAPHCIDPKTLDTVREWSDLENNFSAHPRYDPVKNTWVNHGVGNPDPVAGTCLVSLYEMDADTATITSKPVSLEFPGAALMHDFVLTKNYCLLAWNPCDLSSLGGLKALLGLGAFAEALDLDPDGQHVVICIPRTLLETGAEKINVLTNDRIKRIELPFSFSFHFGNAYEDEDGHVVFDRVETEDRKFDFGLSIMRNSKERPVWEVVPWDDMEQNVFVCYTLDVDNERLLERRTLSETGSIEFPTIHSPLSTKQHSTIYTAGSHDLHSTSEGFSGSLCKFDAVSGELLGCFVLESYEVASEPAVVPKVGGVEEDEAYLLSYVMNGRDRTTDVLILDAKTMKEVSRSRLPTYIPNGALHGRYFEGVTFDFEDVLK